MLSITNVEKQNNFTFERKHQVFLNNENCNVSFDYPVLFSTDSTINLSEINNILYQISIPNSSYCEFNENFIQNDNGVIKHFKQIFTGGYNILLQNDTLLSIEFFTYELTFEDNLLSENREHDTIYHSLVINTKKNLQRSGKRLDLLDDIILQSLPGFDRGKLYPYVENYNKTKNKNINLLAYLTGSNYEITWAITKDEFILYVGGEGEFCGYDKIIIPLIELKQ